MPPRLSEVGLGKIESNAWKPRPDLLDAIEEASGAAAYVKESQPTLIAARKYLMKFRERLPPCRVRQCR